MTVVQKKKFESALIQPKAICRAHHPTKTVEEIAAEMPGAALFSTLNANSGYWQISLDEESSKLCTFNSPWGRYRFKRLPFGINTSGDIFCQAMQEIFGDIRGVKVIVDDLLIHGKKTEEQDNRLRQVLERERQQNVTFNPVKAKIGLPKVHYVGHPRRV